LHKEQKGNDHIDADMEASDLHIAANAGLHRCGCQEQGDQRHPHPKVRLPEQRRPWLIAQSLDSRLESEQ
jgi:hypothetical protein